MYKGNPGRTGEVAGPGPSGDIANLWSISTSGPIKSSPAVVDDVVFIVAGDGHVKAFDVATGTERWTSAEAGYEGNVAATSTSILVGGADGGLASLAIAGGTLSWHVPANAGPNPSPLVTGELVIVTGNDKQVHAFDVATGMSRWTAPVGGDQPRAAAAAGGLVFVASTDGFIYAFAEATGSLAWSHQTTSRGFATPAVRGGTLYSPGGRDNSNGVLYALDAVSGAERWTFTAPNGLGLRSPSVDDAAVYVGAVGGPLYALSINDGSVLWTFDETAATEGTIAIVGDTLYLFGDDERAHAIDRATGRERWQFDIGTGVDSSAAVSAGRILSGTVNGKVIAIGSANLAATSSASPSSSASVFVTLTPEGELTGAPTPLDIPVEVTEAPDGTIWVTEGGAGRFAIFGADGTFKERWGSPGTGKGEFDFSIPDSHDPTGTVAFGPDGDFYVTDSGNFRVQHFDKSRKWLASFGRFGDGDGQFLGQTCLALGPDGRVYVQDGGRADIQVFSPKGGFERVFTAPGTSPDQLNNPLGPAIIGDSLFVADATGGQDSAQAQIKEFKTDGTYVRTIESPGFGNLADLNAGPGGLIFVADWEGRIHVVDPAGKVATSTWLVGPGYPESTVQGLGVSSDGLVYAAEWTFNKVEIFRIPKR